MRKFKSLKEQAHGYDKSRELPESEAVEEEEKQKDDAWWRADQQDVAKSKPGVPPAYRDTREASVLDYVQETFDPQVWDVPENEEDLPTLKEDVAREIISRLQEGLMRFGVDSVSQAYILGSIATQQFIEESDIDVNVRLPEGISEEDTEQITDYFRKSVNEQPLPGTKHPINFFFADSNHPIEVADAAYDLMNDTWLKAPERKEPGFDPQEEFVGLFDQARGWVQKLDLTIGETKRDLIDLELLNRAIRRAGPETRGMFEKKIESKINEIESDISSLVSDYETLHENRIKAFEEELEEGADIKELAVRSELPGNVIYKVIERYRYLTILKQIRQINKETQDEEERIEKVRDVLSKRKTKAQTLPDNVRVESETPQWENGTGQYGVHFIVITGGPVPDEANLTIEHFEGTGLYDILIRNFGTIGEAMFAYVYNRATAEAPDVSGGIDHLMIEATEMNPNEYRVYVGINMYGYQTQQ